MKIGCVIGRFQVPQLHEGHQDILDQVEEICDKIVICLGITPVKMSTKDPLPFEVRREMMLKYYPDAEIFPVYDNRDNDIWSKKLDFLLQQTHPFDEITLYGSRDCFISKYKGKYHTQILEAKEPKHNSTELRIAASKEILNTEDYRKGYISATFNRYPVSYQTVDIAIIDWDRHQILLGKKEDEILWRFPGGFVDVEDQTLEIAAAREASEEAPGLQTDQYQYITSKRVLDWRYKGREDQIMTAFFACHYLSGNTTGGDDLPTVQWFALDDFVTGRFGINNVKHMIVDEHQALMNALIDSSYYQKLPQAKKYENV